MCNQENYHCNTKITGNYGEKRAADFLVKNDYFIVARNFRLRDGEIDIIALKNNTLVFVEVKTMANGSPELLSNVVNTAKQKKIINAAKNFLSKNPQYNNFYIRFDVIALDMPGFPQIYHIEDAFVES